MKSLKTLAFIFFFSAVVLTSCKKDDNSTTTSELETTFELSGKQAISDNLVEDDNVVLMEVTSEQNLAGGRPGDNSTPSSFFGCATVTVTPASGFPKTITIDFGTGCTHNNVLRSGKMIVVLSDSLRRPGATATTTFDNYYVNGFKREGTIVWTNTSTNVTRSWSRQVTNGKVTAPSGEWWLHNGLKNVIQVEGTGTHIPFDDIFQITGNGSTSNSAGRTRSHTILEALVKRNNCENIVRGRLRVDGPNHFAIIDYGNGTCDNLATISIDGNPPRIIQLRP